MLKLLLTSLLIMTYPVYAQRAADAPCIIQANEKKLQGEDRTSFLQICEKQSIISCETVADERGLAGTEKSTFVALCVKGTAGK
jgi:hypothetical protein